MINIYLNNDDALIIESCVYVRINTHLNGRDIKYIARYPLLDNRITIDCRFRNRQSKTVYLTDYS